MRLPFAGWVDVEVEAADPAAAIEAAFAVETEITRGGNLDWCFETLRYITQGNELYADLNEVEVYDENGNEVAW